MTFLETVDQKIITLLNPLIVKDGVKKIERVYFTESAGAGDLLEKYKSSLPCAFLSPPQISYPERDIRVMDMQLNYALLLGFATRSTTGAQESYYKFHELFLNKLFLAELPAHDCPIGRFDFIRPKATTYAQSETEAAMLITFTLLIQNMIRS